MDAAPTSDWTAERFLSWAAGQDGRYEFDGVEPVAMTFGTARHNRIMTNIHAALRRHLRGTRWASYGPDLGIATIDGGIRAPDALVTGTPFAGSEMLAPDPVVVFEVVNPESGRRDRIEKVREYAAVASIMRYVIVESATSGVLVLDRGMGRESWTARALTADDVLDLEERGIRIPVSAFYEDVALPGATLAGPSRWPGSRATWRAPY